MKYNIAYTNPLLPLIEFLLFQSGVGGGGWALLPLSYASESGAARICQRGGQSEGQKRTSERGGGGGEGVAHGREAFLKIRV